MFGNGWGWKSSVAGTDGDGKLFSRGRMGMDTVCVLTDGDGLIYHYRAALYFGYLVHSAAEEDHHHVIAAVLRPPTDWRRPVGRP